MAFALKRHVKTFGDEAVLGLQFLSRIPPEHERIIQLELKQLPSLKQALGLPLYREIIDKYPHECANLLELYIKKVISTPPTN